MLRKCTYGERKRKEISFLFLSILPVINHVSETYSNLLTLASTLITSHSNQQERGDIKRKIQTRSTKCQGNKSIDACLLLPSTCLKTTLKDYVSSCKISLPGLVSHVILFSFSLTEITLALKAWWRKRLNSIFSCLIIFFIILSGPQFNGQAQMIS